METKNLSREYYEAAASFARTAFAQVVEKIGGNASEVLRLDTEPAGEFDYRGHMFFEILSNERPMQAVVIQLLHSDRERLNGFYWKIHACHFQITDCGNNDLILLPRDAGNIILCNNEGGNTLDAIQPHSPEEFKKNLIKTITDNALLKYRP